MAGMRFSHVLLIVALSTWLIALLTNLFFPFILYSFEAAPLFVGTITSIFEIPAHYLVNGLPQNRRDYFAMICFLAAIACSFIAGSVYGMEHESERYLSLFSDFEAGNVEAENAANLSSNDADYYYDLEKGELPPYTSDHESPYTEEDSAFTHTPTSYPSPSSSVSSPAPSTATDDLIGDAMIGQYYDSRAEYEHALSQLHAQRFLITQNRVAELVLGEEHFSDVYHPCSGHFACNTGPAVPPVSGTPCLSQANIMPTRPAGRDVYDPSALPEGGMYAAVIEEQAEFHDVELFNIYETDGAGEGGVWDFDG